jgi:hypothetical protein
LEIILINKYAQAIVIIKKGTPQDKYVFITFHVLIKPHVIKYASRMQAQKDTSIRSITKKRQQNCTRIQSTIITFYNWSCLGFYVEDTICEMEHDSNLKFNTCNVFITFHVLIKPHVIKYASRMQAQKDYFYSAFFTFIFFVAYQIILILPFVSFFLCLHQDVEYWINLNVDLFVPILLKYWSCLTSVRYLHSINYKKRQQNCTRIQSNIIIFYNWNCLGFYVEDTICKMEHIEKVTSQDT